MLRVLAPQMDVHRVVRVERRVEHVERVSAFEEGHDDRLMFFGLSAAMVSLVLFEGDVSLRESEPPHVVISEHED